MQNGASDGYVIQMTFVPHAHDLGVEWASLAVGLGWMLVVARPKSAEFSTLPTVDAVEGGVWARAEVLKAPRMGKRDKVRRQYCQRFCNQLPTISLNR